MQFKESTEQAESLTTEQKLKELKLYISKDYKDFETLCKDQKLQNWVNKIFNKSIQLIFQKECKLFENINIWLTIQKILKKYPNIKQQIIWDLWLSLEEKNFSNLSSWQKINFLSLYRTVSTENWKFKDNISSDDIIPNIKKNTIKILKKINNQFSRMNIKNFLKLKKTLQKNFWLTSEESEKMEKYLEYIKNHPEYVQKPALAQFSGIGSCLSRFILMPILWYLWIYYIDDIWKPNV